MSQRQGTIQLTGRQTQVDRARRWVCDLAEGRGRAVFVEGEPGIGKSLLIRTAARDAQALGCRIFWGTCDELSQAFPLLPLLDALHDEARAAGREIHMPGTDSAPGNRIDVVATVAERLLSLVDDCCARSPVMLVIDDLQFADSATVMTLGRLARAVRQLPLLLVGVARPVPRREELCALRRTLDPDDLLTLPSLSSPEVAELVESVVGGMPGPRLLELAAEAAGNPLYVTELVAALQRARALITDGDRVDAADSRRPGSLAAVIADRLEFLSVRTRDVLRAAALLGADFAVSELAVVSGRRVNDLLPVLDEAILAGVLLDDGARLAFRHPLIRTALYEGMAPAVRAAWHREAARALAEDGAPADRVAQQLLPVLNIEGAAGAADEWMVRWLTGSGQQLVGQAPRVAIPLLRWAVNGVPTGVAPHDVLTCRLADALYRIGDASDAADVAAGALAYVTQPDLLVDLHWTLTQCRAMDAQESLAALQRAVEMPGIGQRDRARLLVLTARTHRTLGKVEAAGRVAAEALDAATAAGDRWATGWALAVLTMTHGMRGEPGEALRLFDRALAVAEGDPELADLRLMLQINQAVALGDLDRYEEAIAAAEQVRHLAEEAGNLVRLAQAQSVLGELLFDVGRWDDALGEIDTVSPPSKNPTVECSDHGVAAAILLHRGDTGACRHLADAARYADGLGDRVVSTLTLARSLEREQSAGPEEALKVLLDGLADNVEDAEESAGLLADAVRLAMTVGDRPTARSVVSRAEALTRSSDVPHRLAIGPHCRGLLDRDHRPLVMAADYYKAAGRPLPRAQALEAAGVVLAESGEQTEARAHFTEAYAVYSELGAEWDLARTQAAFRTYGIRRGPQARHRRSRHGWSSLTPTEQKVVALVARGLSNPQIAARLFLSRRTVQTHVSHILAKLNLQSRIDIAREASRRTGGAQPADASTMF